MTGPAGYSPGRDPDAPHASRAAPLADSICWRPTDGEATGPGAQQYPIYVRQRALAALHDHFRGSATQGILGFLVGALLEDPSTRERWLELEFIVRLTQPIYGDKTTLVISRVWERLQQEVGRTGGHMLGWYHSHPPLGTEIAPGDIEAHEQYFGRPWQIALVLGQTAKGPTGAFYRPSAGLPLGTTPLPFFEIVARDSITAEGRKRTRVTWKNYRPDLRRTSGVMTGASAVLQALQAVPRPPEPAPPRPAEPVPPAAPAPAHPAFAATAAAPPATRAEGRTNTPPRGSGAIRVAATTSPRTAEPPLPPAARVSGGIEKAPEPVAFSRPPSDAVTTPAPPVAEPVEARAAAAAGPPEVADVASAAGGAGPMPEASPTPEPGRPRPRNPAIAGLPIIEPPLSVRASAASPAPAPASGPAPVPTRPATSASAPPPAVEAAPPPAEPAHAPPERLRPSVHSATGLDILRALPAAQTPTERPAVGAAPLPRPSRDRPTSEVLQELADAITRAARTSGAMPAVDAPARGAPRTTAPRKVPLGEAGGHAEPRTPAGGSPAVLSPPPRGPEPGRRESAPVTFTPAPEPPTRRPAPMERPASRESAGVTFTPAGPEPAAGPLEPAFAPKPPRPDSEPEVLPDALRGERQSPPPGPASASDAASPPAPAPRASRVSPRRTFGSGLQAEPEPAGSLVRVPYVLALLAALVGGVWWLAFRPRTASVPVAAAPLATAPVDSGPPPAAVTPVESTAVEPPAVTTPAESIPSAPPAVVPDVLTPLDLLVDSLDAAIFQYLDRAAVFDAGERDCQVLAAALVGVDRLWVAYNAQRRRLDAPLDSLRTLRDQAAYANVEAVDTHFGRSGCPRP